MTDIAPLAAKAREALDRRKQDLWLVGDLAGEAAPPGDPGAHDARLHEFAEESGWLDDGRSLGSLGDLRRTALTWSKAERAAYPSMSPWTARRLNGREDRLDIVAEAAASHPRGRVTEQAVRALLANDDIALAVQELRVISRDPVLRQQFIEEMMEEDPDAFRDFMVKLIQVSLYRNGLLNVRFLRKLKPYVSPEEYREFTRRLLAA